MLRQSTMFERDGTEEPHSELAAASEQVLRESIIDALRLIYDPELPVNIYDLGLIYRIDIETGQDTETQVNIDMTLTAPACPVAGTLPGSVAAAIRKLDGVGDAEVRLVWDPPWSVDKMSEDARMILGMYD